MGDDIKKLIFRLFGSVNVPALDEEQWREVQILATLDMSRGRS